MTALYHPTGRTCSICGQAEDDIFKLQTIIERRVRGGGLREVLACAVRAKCRERELARTVGTATGQG